MMHSQTMAELSIFEMPLASRVNVGLKFDLFQICDVFIHAPGTELFIC
jgi:hypothetical protein